VESFMNYLEEQTDGEAMIHSIKNGDQPLPRVTQVSIAGTTSTEQPPLKDKSMWNKTAKDLWDALARHMLGSEYEVKRKLLYLRTLKETYGEAMINSIQNGDQPLPVIAQVSLAKNAQNAPPTLKDLKFWTAEEKKTRKIDRLERSLLIQGLSNDIYSLIDSNETTKDLWDALKRQMRVLSDVNDALGYKKKVVVIYLDPLALVAEKIKVSKRKEKVVVSSDSKRSGADDFSELKKITALFAKAFNRRKFY
nr:hypothetical protein [Tanacetum cinerariifolium]